jgi:methyl-accepting chemotaxis protein
MYAGFSLIVIMFIVTVLLMIDGMNNIYAKFETVTQSSLPLVANSNKTSVQLLSADKLFKDYLTSDDHSRMEQIRQEFSQSQALFSDTFKDLQTVSRDYPQAQQNIEALKQVEASYFSEAQLAMDNYRDMFEAESRVVKSSRDFQRMNIELTVGMKEYVSKQSSISVKLMAKSYFSKLEDAQKITADALSSLDTELVQKAVTKNKKAVTHLNYAFNGLSAQSPELKEKFGSAVEKFTRDIGMTGGVLDQYNEFLHARHKLYQNIANLTQQVDQAMEILGQFNELATQELDSSLSEAGAIYSDGLVKATVIGIGVVIIAALIGFNIARSVRMPLTQILSTLENLANGDMTKRIENRYNNEFAQVAGHINTLADNLHNILVKLNGASDNLTGAANTNQATSSSAQEQLSNQREQTANVATAMTEMEHSVVEVAQSAQSTSEKVQLVENASESGRQIMSTNITTINQLEVRLNESVSAVAELQQMSGQIGSILDVIQNIAEQTNLLALNAAIEAARAGEQGRGFAVVADEVRVLAQKTSESTSEIEGMINDLQKSSKGASQVIQSCMQDMELSVSQASQANSSMEEIQALILEISQMSSHISHAAAEQSKTTSDIARNLEDINLIAEKSHQAMSEIASVSTTLTGLAQEQSELVHQFKL